MEEIDLTNRVIVQYCDDCREFPELGRLGLRYMVGVSAFSVLRGAQETGELVMTEAESTALWERLVDDIIANSDEIFN